MEAGGAPTSVKAHNNRTTFMLGTGDAPDMYSTSQRDAFKGLAPEPEDPKLAAPAASKQRESRIVLGNDTFEYISTSKADEKAWGAKEAEEARGKYILRDTRATSYSLGHAKSDFGTTQADAFVTYKVDPKDQEEERKRQAGVRSELRHTHFTLGDAETDYTTTTSAGYAAEADLVRAVAVDSRREQDAHQKARVDELRRPHIDFGDAKPEWTTTNALPAHKVGKFSMTRKYMHGTSFTLGDDKCDWQTTSYAAEGKPPEQRVKLGTVDVPRRDVDWKAQLEKAMATKEI